MDISLEEENSDLKLELNASQQEKASLDLKIRQKEEIILKAQAELLAKEQAYREEIRKLNEEIDNTVVDDSTDSKIKELEESNKMLIARETKLANENIALATEVNIFKKTLSDFQDNNQEKLDQYSKLREDYDRIKKHLANIELSFSDLHQKYERSKSTVEQYNLNEQGLIQKVNILEDHVQKYEEKYETLKTHAKGQIDKVGKEMMNIRDDYESEVLKLQTKVRQMEIKNSSLLHALDQKIRESQALMALCDEVTGKP